MSKNEKNSKKEVEEVNELLPDVENETPKKEVEKEVLPEEEGLSEKEIEEAKEAFGKALNDAIVTCEIWSEKDPLIESTHSLKMLNKIKSDVFKV